jgi:hypothetical protein
MHSKTPRDPNILHHTAPFLHPSGVKEVWPINTGKNYYYSTSFTLSPIHLRATDFGSHVRARGVGEGS